MTRCQCLRKLDSKGFSVSWLSSTLKTEFACWLTSLRMFTVYFRHQITIFSSIFSAWCLSYESQNGVGWKGALEIIWPKPTARAGPPTAGCPGPCPDGFWISPRMETPQPPWVTFASAQSPSQWKRVSWCWEATSCVSVCARCLWSCHWAPLKGAWLHLLFTLPSAFCTHWWDSPWAFSSLG